MKSTSFLSVVLCILGAVNSKTLDSLAPFAAIAIIEGHFATVSGKFDIISCGTAEFTEKWLHFLLRHQKLVTSIQLSTCNVEIIKLNTSTLLIFESPEDFRDTAEKIVWQTNKSKRHRHLVYIQNGTKNDVTQTVKDGFLIDNVAFLVNETENSIKLAISYMFTERKCRENQLVTINRFQKNTMKWESDNFFPEKYRNMHACPLTVLEAIGVDLADIFELIMREMSEDLKFRIERVKVRSQSMQAFID